MKQVRLDMNNHRGFTLIELLITMALVIVVIMITGSAFESVLKSTARIASSEESNIEGVVGLEIFRHDLQQMGFGLPSAFQTTPPVYTEATIAPANLLNDAPSRVPRAVTSWESVSGYTTVLAGTDYLAIKATTVGRTKTSQKWTYLGYSTSKKPANNWPNAADNLTASTALTSHVVVINRTFSTTGAVTNNLVCNIAGAYDVSYTNGLFDDEYVPTNPQQTYYLYGIAESSLGMPFNRADYFVARPSDASSIPTTCAPGTGILYKKNVNHNGGGLTPYPLLDCVADMQVVFGWDVNGNGVIDESSAYESDEAKMSVSSSIGTTKAAIKAIMESPDEIRNKLRYIKVYIMAQEGRKDTNFTNAAKIVVGDIEILTKGYDVAVLTTNKWLNYRWKIYRIVVRPKNLATN